MDMIVMFVLIVVGVLVVVARRGLQMKKLVERGIPVVGRVVSRGSRASSGAGGRATHHLRYEFTAADGRTYGHRITVTGAEHESVREGDEIELVYLPDNPKVSAQASMVAMLSRGMKEKGQ